MSADLAAFLLARIEREEQFARFVGDDNPEWHLYDGNAVTSDDGTTLVAECQMRSDAEYIVHWDPARVLAECEARRRIVERARFVDDHGPAVDHTRALDMTIGASAALRDVLRFLAEPYSSHPDYDPAWRP